MKVWSNERMEICGSDKWQEIKYAFRKDTGEDEAYVRYRNERVYLSDFTTSVHGYKEESALCGTRIDGAFADTFFSGFLVRISPDGERAKIFYCYCR